MVRVLSSLLILLLICGCRDTQVGAADLQPQEPPVAGGPPPPPQPGGPPVEPPPPPDTPLPEEDPPAVTATDIDPRQVKEAITRAAEWQLVNPVEHDPRKWMMGALYSGLVSASEVTAEPRFLAAVLRAGERIDFILGSRTYHADGHSPGHAWLSIHLMDPERPVRARCPRSSMRTAP